MTAINPIRAKIESGIIPRGTFINVPDPALVEVAGLSGFDWVFIDAEHGPMGVETVESMVRAAETVGVVPILRMPYPDPELINRYLDTGARGVLVPHLSTPELAKTIIEHVKYHPAGKRGAGGSTRAARWGLAGTHAEYVERANAGNMIFGILEDRTALDNVEEVVKVDGIDGFVIGPSDLSHSLGFPGDIRHPEVQQAVQRLSDVVVKSGKALCRVVMSADMETVRKELDSFFELGAKMVAQPLFRMLQPGVENFLKHGRTVEL